MTVNCQHLVRVGLMGRLSYLHSADATRFSRGLRVICRTERGLEVGQVLSTVERDAVADGTIIRGMTAEDELLIARLERYRHEAFMACREFLNERKLPVVLMDVEQLFDGSALYFYFLGTPPAELDAFTDQLAATYAAKVKYYEFHSALTEGCGPGCGTEEKSGCGTSGGCSTCAIAAACHGKASARSAANN